MQSTISFMNTVHLLIYETCILYNYMTAFITQHTNSCYKRATESAERAQPRCFVYRPPVRPIVCPSHKWINRKRLVKIMKFSPYSKPIPPVLAA